MTTTHEKKIKTMTQHDRGCDFHIWCPTATQLLKEHVRSSFSVEIKE